ncbi:MAG: DUF2946 family protein [Lysobacteraceae bacterium]
MPVTRRCHRLFGRFALVAMLLLASIPTVGRLAGGTPSPHAAAMPAHAMAGMAHATGHGAHPHAAPSRQPAHPHGEDCAYCTLLGATMPAVAAALAWPASLPDIAPRSWPSPSRPALPPGALGSRGPPARA